MKEIIFDTTKYLSKNETYKDFYNDFYTKLDGANTVDFEDYNNLHYNADILEEFLWYKSEDTLKYIFVGLDIEKISNEKSSDNYEWRLIVDVFRDFVTKYRNNAL